MPLARRPGARSPPPARCSRSTRRSVADCAATIGGMLATGDSGPLRHRYGAPRDLVLGMTVALSDGTIARSGGKVIKNVAGYDLAKLFAGSFGTLGADPVGERPPAPAAGRDRDRARRKRRSRRPRRSRVGRSSARRWSSTRSTSPGAPAAAGCWRAAPAPRRSAERIARSSRCVRRASSRSIVDDRRQRAVGAPARRPAHARGAIVRVAAAPERTAAVLARGRAVRRDARRAGRARDRATSSSTPTRVARLRAGCCRRAPSPCCSTRPRALRAELDPWGAAPRRRRSS